MLAPLDTGLLAALKRELRADEQLLWSGMPDRQTAFLSGFAIYIFAVPWAAFALYWEAMALRPWLGDAAMHGAAGIGASMVMPIFGLPFVGIGLIMLAAPFLARSTAERTIYGITDRRAIRLRGGRFVKVSSVEPQHFGPITRKERQDGRGTIKIALDIERERNGRRKLKSFDIRAIDDVRHVEELLRRIGDTAG